MCRDLLHWLHPQGTQLMWSTQRMRTTVTAKWEATNQKQNKNKLRQFFNYICDDDGNPKCQKTNNFGRTPCLPNPNHWDNLSSITAIYDNFRFPAQKWIGRLALTPKGGRPASPVMHQNTMAVITPFSEDQRLATTLRKMIQSKEQRKPRSMLPGKSIMIVLRRCFCRSRLADEVRTDYYEGKALRALEAQVSFPSHPSKGLYS